MKIADILRRNANTDSSSIFIGSGSVKPAENNSENVGISEHGSIPLQDRVTISPAARTYLAVSETLESSKSDTKETDESRQARISNIKRRIESGDYKVSSTDVAKSLASYFGLITDQERDH